MAALTLLTLFLIGYVIYLDRRLGRLERLAGQAGRDAPIFYSEEHGEPEEEPAPTLEEPPARQPARIINATSSEPFVAPDPTPAVDDPAIDADEPDSAPSVFSFEELFGRRLPIWAGGITLAIAGMLIVKLSIEAGLLSPAVRVISGTMFGFLLIGAAEAALRNQARVRDARVRQALAGAGIASLYASVLIAANVYHLIPPMLAMTGAAAVTAMAMVLAIRFGAPSALLGLAGGLAAPALIGSSEPNVPLLSLYLALAVGGLATLSRSQRWVWLGISALVGGFGWGLVLLVGGALDVPASISLGLYILLLGIGLPSLGLAGSRSDQLQLLAGIFASAQMAALVATGDFAMLNWGLFATLAVAAVWLANREPALDRLPAVGLTVALLLCGAWPNPAARDLALVLAGTALIFGTMPLRRLWMERGGLLDAAQVAAVALAGWLLPMVHFHRGIAANDLPLGLLAAGLAVAVSAVAALGWRNAQRREDARFAILSVTAAVLAAAAMSLLLPGWSVGIAIAALGFALLHLGQIGQDRRLEPFAWTFAAGGMITFFLPDVTFGNSTAVVASRFALMTLVAAMFAWRGGYRQGRDVAQFLAPLLLYGALAPFLDEQLEPLIAPLTLLALAWAGDRFQLGRLVPAMGSAALVVLLWAAWPLLQWSIAALASVMGEPVLAGAVPDESGALRRLLLPGLFAGIAVAVARSRLQRREQHAGLLLAAMLTGVAVHSLYKQVFVIDTLDAFAVRGLAERTVWQILLTGAAVAAMRFDRTPIAIALAGAAAAHFGLYTLLLHNPLWAPQHVGSWPFLNMLLPSYGLALALAVAASRLDLGSSEWRRAISAVQVLLILFFAFSTLRQLFHGSLLVSPGLGQAEDIGRSIVAIALAIGFLLCGIAKEDRDWRLASLALMLAAVGKVFLFDASGLEGVTRIASFIALGISLIGIGWLYARFLPNRGPQVASA